MSTDLDPRTIAADIMCGNARSITPGEVWAHIGQAYDTTEIDATIADDVAELIAKTGIDLIWPDGTKSTELDAVRIEVERLTAELARTNGAFQDAVHELSERYAERDQLRSQLAEQQPVITAVKRWRESADVQTVGLDDEGMELVDAYDAYEIDQAEATR